MIVWLAVILFAPTAFSATDKACVTGMAAVAPTDGWLADEHGELHPPNWKRHVDKPPVTVRPFENLPFLATEIKRDPDFLFGPGDGLDAAFNPTAWREVDRDGREIVPVIVRGEKNTNDAAWKRHSLPYLAIYRPDRPGHKPKISKEPILKAEGIYEEAGGMEDFRFADLKLEPARYRGADGTVRQYSKMLTYTAFDGTTARICGVLFNEHGDFATGKAVKIGPMFEDGDIKQTPMPGIAWNKSAAVIQYLDRGKVRTVAYWNEGNEKHGGVWANDVPVDFTKGKRKWSYPVSENAEPVIKARPDYYDQNLVEPAFQPVLTPQGIVVAIHGDSPGVGYQLGYRIFSPTDPTGKPIYESQGTFFKPEHPVEKTKGQVAGVVFMPAMVPLQDGSVHFFWGAGDLSVGHGTSRLK